MHTQTNLSDMRAFFFPTEKRHVCPSTPVVVQSPLSQTPERKQDMFTARQPAASLPGYRYRNIRFGDDTRKIMTYNVDKLTQTRHGFWGKHAESRKALGRVILAEAPDVIALQEVGSRATLELFNRNYLNGEYPTIVQFPIASDYANGIRPAIMAKGDLALVDSKSHYAELQRLKCRHVHRNIIEATFRTPNGYEFTVITAHFRSMTKGEEASFPIRLEEAQLVSEIIQAHLNRDPDAHIVLAGDLNTLYTSPHGQQIIRTLAMKDDNDFNNDLTDPLLQNQSNNRFAERVPATHHPRTPGLEQCKLDYMFLSPAMLEQVEDSYVVGRSDRGPWKVASNHQPMVVVVKETENANPFHALRHLLTGTAA